MAQLDLKTKYSRMLNMLKGKPDAEEKTKQIEEKKKVEEQQVTKELIDKKTERVNQIKEGYNEKAAEVKVDYLEIKKAVIAWSQTKAQLNNPENGNSNNL